MSISLDLTDEGNFVLVEGRPQLLTGDDNLVQKLKRKLRTFFDEYFTDITAGVKYFTLVIGQKPPRLSEFSTHVQSEIILTTDGIVDVINYSQEVVSVTGVPGQSQKLKIKFDAVSESGITLPVEEVLP